MFVVTIDVWPWGDASNSYTQSTIVACNDGTSDSTRYGNYQAILVEGGGAPYLLKEKLNVAMAEGVTARVVNFPRKRSQEHLPALVGELIESLGCHK